MVYVCFVFYKLDIMVLVAHLHRFIVEGWE